ncbi:magnesium/cobalt transporter CorA [Planomicrobium sp. CPCC 101110]|uniref:magnesium/cobalt transporter CorA n=1 Tax=Planomicrobium sp. CPCC 101110 TaxID=2599619 RepID=UPI0011B79FC0|nr:magnesium/cobalt transporter CorA [Planomicrobium sp. CPCC 101110]TWT26394.1 magnesium/cobalt transporter CorA [Planomicrobium sp. CPCC 101110]
MLRILAINKENDLLINPPLDSLENMKWYWADFNMPTDEETSLLGSYFHFHPLAIEDCIHSLQRPKLEHYENLSFLVFHTLNEKTLEASEVDLFITENFTVSFHYEDLQEVNYVWDYFQRSKSSDRIKPVEVVYKIMDKVVDSFFPITDKLEDHLLGIENSREDQFAGNMIIQKTFDIRKDLLKLRQTVLPMRDLVYRILESKRFIIQEQKRAYFQDIHDHLIKLSQIIESNRELTSDIRDSYISMNSFRMNNIMKTLTVITTIFMPLTFLAGIYGMNFQYMPELQWEAGYFVVLAVMLFTGIGMFLWFKNKGWFDSE